jgi:hypothetical protein
LRVAYRTKLVVGGLTTTADKVDGAAFAIVVGMIAAILFNVINIPARIVLSAGFVAAGGGGDPAAGAALGGVMGGLGALSNIVGIIFFSPIGYGLGGVIGAVIND